MAEVVTVPIRFPAIALSRAGWVKTGASLEELTDASPADDLSEWQQMRIVDSTGATYLSTRTFRAWPVTRGGMLLCKLLNNAIYVGFDLELVEPIALAELLDTPAIRGTLPQSDWPSTRQVVAYLCED